MSPSGIRSNPQSFRCHGWRTPFARIAPSFFMVMRRILDRWRTRESTCPELARQPLRGVAVGLAGKAAGGVRGVELFDHLVGRNRRNICFGPEQCGPQHSSWGAVEALPRRGRGGGERTWLRRATAQDRNGGGGRAGPHTPSKKISRGLHEKQALWRAGCLRAGPKQIRLRRLFQPALEEENDDVPLREGPED